MGLEELSNLGKIRVFLSCRLQGSSCIWVGRPTFILAVSWDLPSRRMSWTTIKSSVGGDRFDPASGSSSNNSSRGLRLIKAIQVLRSKLLVKIQEIKKDLPKKLFFLLVGFYSATAFSTFIGQTGDWDVLSAGLAVLVVECIGALMYRASIPLINKMRSTITMFNYWKTGLALGLFLDSFKYEIYERKFISFCLYALVMVPVNEKCENPFDWTQVLAWTSEKAA
ncbi:unnamed protein product [Arabidopsis thaliana]|uniref:Ycf20-like protein n=1 Tax=Arabidopsis thaliana TaxID=3702 RepID=A0A654FHB6_ARATH|nr:unnamed protein product [Arabidopsis thaliana]